MSGRAMLETRTYSKALLSRQGCALISEEPTFALCLLRGSVCYIAASAAMASGGSASPAASGNVPQKIQRLDEAVVNKIAAGEVSTYMSGS